MTPTGLQDFFDPTFVGAGKDFVFQLVEGDPLQLFAVGFDGAGRHIPNAFGDAGVPDSSFPGGYGAACPCARGGRRKVVGR